VAGSVREALSAATDAIRAAGVEEARLDAEVLLEHATGWERARLAASPEAAIPADAARRFGEMVRRRLRREPVAYIVGAKWFRNIELEIDRRVLIPRPETEMLVDLAVELRPSTALDVGTGSGAVALAVADELPDCEVTATDTSPAALEVARANARRLGLSSRVSFQEGSLPVDPERFELAVANLPYVADAEWASLQPELTEWEPREALLAGPDGLDAIRALLEELRALCASRLARQTANALPRVVALEVGAGQAPAVAVLMREAGLGSVDSRSDLTGIERVVVGRR
jgi:release factor glutamine methyltransferase